MSDPVAFIDDMFAGDVQSVEIRKSEWLAAKAELIARRHGLTAEQVAAARESLLQRVENRMRAGQETCAEPIDDTPNHLLKQGYRSGRSPDAFQRKCARCGCLAAASTPEGVGVFYCSYECAD